MRLKSIIIIIFCSCFGVQYVIAQNEILQNTRTRYIPYTQDTLILDTLSIMTSSFQIETDMANYRLDPYTTRFVWIKNPGKDSIQVSYRVFPLLFSKKYSHKDKSLYETNFAINPNYYSDEYNQNRDKFVDFGTLDYNGTFGRALSFGNNQDVTLNSQFNLQLEGDIGDSIKIRGALTDNTIPFQPEGNTQQIQEFDRVTIELERKKSKLTVGDFEIERPKGYFMNYFKRVQGAMFQNTLQTKEGLNKVRAKVALAKGKWVRNVLTALEGNQGPYKLTGPNGEQYFIVLAGTERVYIDGIQMERGENRDYVIDYNTAEVTFMPRRLITKDLRIIVEFEFSDRNYLNSLISVNDEWKVNSKVDMYLNVYSNQDAKNQSIIQELDATQKQYLATIGDSIHEAVYPSVRYVDTFSNTRILYKKTDSTVNGITFPDVYIFSTHPDSAKYSLTFSNVGTGRGNYIQSVNAANGRVYAWVAPENGIPQGDYEPVEILVTPKLQQLFSLGSEIKVGQKNLLRLETSLSNYDPNTFSSIDNGQHPGFAGKVIYNDERRVSRDSSVQLLSEFNYEYVQSRFKPVERFRNVEFVRDWNINSQENMENEHLGFSRFKLMKNEYGYLAYSFGTFIRGNSYSGFQHIPELLFNRKGYRVFITGNHIGQKSEIAHTQFFRPRVEIEKHFEHFKNLTLSAKYLQEKNTYRNPQTDSLQNGAFNFHVYRFQAKSNTEKGNTYGLEYMIRDDQFAKENQFKVANTSQTLSLNSQVVSIEGHNIQLTSAFRQMNVVDSSISPQKADESLLGRLDYSGRFLKGLISAQILYEFGSGQEQKREFAYVEVPAGQGVYVWRDYNNDGLRQLNEFEIAVFQDEKRFIKVFTPTNQYVKAKYSQFNSSINITPRNAWSGSDITSLQKFLNRFTIQSAIQLNNRFLGERGIRQYNPFIHSFEDSSLITNASSFINSFFFNRNSNKWGLDYIQNFNGGKTLLNYGIDSRKHQEHLLRGRWNVTQKIALQINGKRGFKSSISPFLDGRNFHIEFNALEPSLTFLFKQNQLRVSTSYKYDERKNDIQYGNEQAFSNSVVCGLKYNIPGSGSIAVNGTYNIISYNGENNTGVSYSMLDGLNKGKNWLWNATFDKRLSNSIEMSLQYEGRKSGSNGIIHTGRASVRAIF